MTNQIYSTAEIYDTLKQEILQLDYPPGQQISENELSKRFQVSRTPIKAAFTRLECEGFITVLPQRGTFVSLLNLGQIKDAIFMRTVMEAEMVRLICNQLTDAEIGELEGLLDRQQRLIAKGNCSMQDFYQSDDDFHRTLFEKAGHPYVWQEIQKMQVQYTRFRMLDIKENKSFQEVHGEHRALLSAIQNRDAAQYAKEIHHHLQRNIVRLEKHIQGDIQAYFVGE